MPPLTSTRWPPPTPERITTMHPLFTIVATLACGITGFYMWEAGKDLLSWGGWAVATALIAWNA